MLFRTENNRVITSHHPVDLKTRILRQLIREWTGELDTFLPYFSDISLRDFTTRLNQASDCFDDRQYQEIHKVFTMMLNQHGLPLDVTPSCFTILVERFLAIDHINMTLKDIANEQHPLELMYTHHQVDVSKTAKKLLDQFDCENLFQNPRLFIVAAKTGLIGELQTDFYALNHDENAAGIINPESQQMINAALQGALEFGQIPTAHFLLSTLNQAQQTSMMVNCIPLIYRSLHSDKILELLWGKSTPVLKTAIAQQLTKKLDVDNELHIDHDPQFEIDFSEDVIGFISHNPQHRICTDMLDMLDEQAKNVWLKTCMRFPNLKEHSAFTHQIWESMEAQTQRQYVIEMGGHPQQIDDHIVTTELRI